MAPARASIRGTRGMVWNDAHQRSNGLRSTAAGLIRGAAPTRALGAAAAALPPATFAAAAAPLPIGAFALLHSLRPLPLAPTPDGAHLPARPAASQTHAGLLLLLLAAACAVAPQDLVLEAACARECVVFVWCLRWGPGVAAASRTRRHPLTHLQQLLHVLVRPSHADECAITALLRGPDQTNTIGA
jgi:hypothetical protein